MPPVDLQHLFCLNIIYDPKPAEFDVIPVLDCLRCQYTNLFIQFYWLSFITPKIGYLNLEFQNLRPNLEAFFLRPQI